jgi:hypothetical protein
MVVPCNRVYPRGEILELGRGEILELGKGMKLAKFWSKGYT